MVIIWAMVTLRVTIRISIHRQIYYYRRVGRNSESLSPRKPAQIRSLSEKPAQKRAEGYPCQQKKSKRDCLFQSFCHINLHFFLFKTVGKAIERQKHSKSLLKKRPQNQRCLKIARGNPQATYHQLFNESCLTNHFPRLFPLLFFGSKIRLRSDILSSELALNFESISSNAASTGLSDGETYPNPTGVSRLLTFRFGFFLKPWLSALSSAKLLRPVLIPVREISLRSFRLRKRFLY